MDKRPSLNTEISIADFRDFYWLKEELVRFCQREGLRKNGNKIELTERIELYLATGERQEINLKPRSKSKFDWSNEVLSPETRITDNYKNTENTRRFFKEEIGEHFKFNVKFMNWMKSNSGKTLSDAIEEWKRIKTDLKNNTSPKVIELQFEYNRYLRDFMADNPGLKRELGIRLWKIKRSMRGDNIYSKEDFKLLDEVRK